MLPEEGKKHYAELNRKDHKDAMKDSVPISRTTAHMWVKRECKIAKLGPHVSCHWFRHWFATQAIRNGSNIKDLQKQLGHKNSKTTIDVYLHEDQNRVLRVEYKRKKKSRKKKSRKQHKRR